MAIKRYTATKDNTLTNAYRATLTTRGTDANMGESDSLEVFYIAKQVAAGSVELSRIIMQFPVASITADRTAGSIPASGSVSFYLRAFNAEHPFTLPRQATLTVNPVSSSWTEGIGLDMEDYSDLDVSNWLTASSGSAWTSEGGDYLSSPVYEQTFQRGWEHLEIDISDLVEQWVDGTIPNYGIGIKLTGSQETGSNSYYTKRFFARGSEFFYKRPIIEARWDDSRKDHRNYFVVSSSALSAADNLNTVYFYNFFRGQLKNLPGVGTGSVYVSLHTSASGGTALTPTPNSPVTGGWVATGIYSASFALNSTASVFYDRWYSGSIAYHTGCITPQTFQASNANYNAKYVANITNLKKRYYTTDNARFRVYTRAKDWQPNIYVVASNDAELDVIEDLYYRIERTVDRYPVIDYGTGSLNHTRLSYDSSGSYFDLDMSLLEKSYMYTIKFANYANGSYRELAQDFKFRVER